jgi:enoyl-CoA hydratase/carnithine racemase
VARVSSPLVLTESGDRFLTITLNRPERRNALSLEVLEALAGALAAAGGTDARAVILAANGPVFSAGHDFADLAGASIERVRNLLETCASVVRTMQGLPQPVIARVHGLATAAGCQLVASADLAVASTDAAFAIPGGKGGWFCHTPLVAVARTVSSKHALELALTGDAIDAGTALAWGLVNRVVPPDELDEATLDLARRAVRGSASSKALGKRTFYEQVGLDQDAAYAYATQVMALSSQSADAQEGFAAFLEKRRPVFDDE